MGCFKVEYLAHSYIGHQDSLSCLKYFQQAVKYVNIYLLLIFTDEL